MRMDKYRRIRTPIRDLLPQKLAHPFFLRVAACAVHHSGDDERHLFVFLLSCFLRVISKIVV